MYQTRTCNPAGCNTSVRCQDTASCATPCEQNLFTFDYRYPQSGGYGRQYTSFRDPYHNILGGACIIPTGIVPPGAPAGTGGCWVNDHKFVWIKIHNPRGLYNAGFQFYGYFDGESGEDLRIIVNNDRSSAPYRDANLPIQTGWNWINMGRFMLQPGVNYIGMTNPLYEQEMADGQDDDLDGTSVHFGYFIFTCN